MRRALRLTSRAAAAAFVVVLLYGLLLAFPEPLFAHRSDLAALGVGTIAVAFLCLNAAVLL